MKIADINLWFYAIALILGIVTWALTRRVSFAFLIAYSFLVISTTILRRPVGERAYQLIPFWSYSNPRLHQQIIANVLMFVPIGIIGARIWRWKVIPIALAFSALIEFTQLISKRGLFEFDDIIHNTLGAVIGFALTMLVRTIWQYMIQKNERK